jgi:hypothetical protein
MYSLLKTPNIGQPKIRDRKIRKNHYNRIARSAYYSPSSAKNIGTRCQSKLGEASPTQRPFEIKNTKKE